MLPYSHAGSYLIRTSFDDESRWLGLVDALKVLSAEGFLANVDPISDRTFEGATESEIIAAISQAKMPVVSVADRFTLHTPGFPVLLLNAMDPASLPLRVNADVLWGPVNNLLLFNMSWDEFEAMANPDGIIA